MRGISWSVSPGTIGAAITPTGTPAAASRAIASSRRRGLPARGSMVRAISGSRVVIETETTAARWPASSASRSASRATRALLVMTPTGLRASASTSRHRRVISSFLSTGW